MQPADLILSGGRIITLGASSQIASAIAIADGKILAVGESATVRALASEATRCIDLRGRTVVPGLIDAHAHMDREGLKEMLPSLAGCRSIADVVRRIAEIAATRKPGEWIVTMPLGDPPDFRNVPDCLAERRFPTRHDLDRAAPDNPVYIKAIWGPWRHTMPLVSVANSRALDLAGISRTTVPPSASVQIDRDFKTGEPSGVFMEWTLYPLVEFTLMAAAPGFTVEQRTCGLERSMRIYNSLGTTSVFEGHGVAADVLMAFEAVRRSNRQSVRSTLAFSPAWSRTAGTPAAVFASWGKWLAGRGYGDEWLRLMGMHAEVGDSEEHRMRARLLPQTGWAGFHYDSNLPRPALKELLLECARSGVSVIGLTPEMIDVFAEVDREIPLAGKRWSLGHIIALDAQRIARIADMGLIVTTHTNRYIFKEGASLAQRLGPGRAHELVPLRSLVDAGVRVCLATDNVPPSLFHPVWHAVARRSRDGNEPIGPEQALTRQEALACASRNGAYLSREEDQKGTLEAGKFADLAVLTNDPLACAEDEIPSIRAAMTIVGGRVVHDALATEIQ